MRYVLPSGGPVYIPSSDFSTYVLNNLKTTNAPASSVIHHGARFIWKFFRRIRATPVTAALDPALGCGDFAGTAGWGVIQALQPRASQSFG